MSSKTRLAPTSRGSSQTDADVAPGEPDAHESHVEAGRGAGDAHVAGQGEGEPATGGGTVDGRDHGLTERAQVGHERGDVLLGRETASRGAEAVGARSVARPPQVQPGAEASPGAGKDDDSTGAISGRLVEGAMQVGHELVVHRIQALGPIQRDAGDARLDLVEHHGVHLVISIGGGTVRPRRGR